MIYREERYIHMLKVISDKNHDPKLSEIFGYNFVFMGWTPYISNRMIFGLFGSNDPIDFNCSPICDAEVIKHTGTLEWFGAIVRLKNGYAHCEDGPAYTKNNKFCKARFGLFINKDHDGEQRALEIIQKYS